MAESNSASSSGKALDAREKKRQQNRAAQKTYREKLKRRIEDLEKWREVALCVTAKSQQPQNAQFQTNSERSMEHQAMHNGAPSSFLRAPTASSGRSPQGVPYDTEYPSPSRTPLEEINMDVIPFDWSIIPSQSTSLVQELDVQELPNIVSEPPPTIHDQGMTFTSLTLSPSKIDDLGIDCGDSHGASEIKARRKSSLLSYGSSSSLNTCTPSTSPRADIHIKGQTPLHLAVTRNQPNMVRIISQKMWKLDARDDEGRTALHLAVELGNAFITQILATCARDKKEDLAMGGLSVNVQDANGFTPLHIAILKEDEAMVNTLLEFPELNLEVKDSSGRTPLHSAILAGLEGVADALIAKGADLDTRVG